MQSMPPDAISPTPPASTPAPRGDWREGLPPGFTASVEVAALPAARAIQFDSRAVEAGDVFVCIPGERADGHAFAPQAVAAGAVVLVVQQGVAPDIEALGVPVVRVPDTRRALSSLAAAHEGFPARRLSVIGVTGTDGKSTTSFLTLAALAGCGVKAGLLTTIECHIGDRVIPNPTRLTTQEAPFIQSLLAEMVEAGCTHAVIEATSHGLALHRLDDIDLDVAVFTNLSEDHLDFHGSMQAYRAAKARLFQMLDAPTTKKMKRHAILNADDRAWQAFASATKADVITYGVDNPRADVCVQDVMLWPDGATFVLASGEGGEDEIEASIQMPGAFNVANATAAITAVGALGLDVFAAASGVADCKGVPGRMERIEGAPFEVIVDYAHTPAALEQVLTMLRPVVEGRLILVFGCAGERARDRRTGLGSVAARLTDFTVLTDEDPRSEPPDAIIAEIANAMLAAGAEEDYHFARVRPRRQAIQRAIEHAEPGDMVLIAGKGHESTIEWADHAEPWDDRAAAREAIALRYGSPAEN